MPPNRSISSKVLKKEWKCSSRGLESRVRKGFELALKYNLQCYVVGSKSKSQILKRLSGHWKDKKIVIKREEVEKLIKTE